MKKDTYINFILLVITSLLFLSISVYTNKIQARFLGDSALFEIFSTINNSISLFIPLTLFIFYLITSFLVLQLFDHNTQLIELTTPILTSFTPIIFYCTIYLLLLVELSNYQTFINSDILLKEGLLGLNLTTLNSISLYFWIAFYLLLIYNLKRKLSISFGTALVVALFPTAIIFIVKLII